MRRLGSIPVVDRIFLGLLFLACVAGGWATFRYYAPEPSPSLEAFGFRPIRPPLTLGAIADLGAIRLGVARGTPSFFLDSGRPRGFEYELLRAFAEELDVALRVVTTSSPEISVGDLFARRIDLAVLPWIGIHVDGAVRLGPYVRPGLRDPGPHPSFPETGAIFVREDSPELVHALEAFLVRTQRDGRGRILYERAFGGRSARERRLADRPPEISPYDSLLRTVARESAFDWRFLAAVMLEESGHDPAVVSHRGAIGLMQVRPVAARQVGIRELGDPESNLRAGLRYLEYLSSQFVESTGTDHLAIVLAAYLMGPGHVRDAQWIARTLGLHPDRWRGGLDQVMPLLEEPEYHAFLDHGFARGRQALVYVERILERTRLYVQHLE